MKRSQLKPIIKAVLKEISFYQPLPPIPSPGKNPAKQGMTSAKQDNTPIGKMTFADLLEQLHYIGVELTTEQRNELFRQVTLSTIH